MMDELEREPRWFGIQMTLLLARKQKEKDEMEQMHAEAQGDYGPMSTAADARDETDEGVLDARAQRVNRRGKSNISKVEADLRAQGYIK